MIHLHEVLGEVKIIQTDSRKWLPGSREREDQGVTVSWVQNSSFTRGKLSYGNGWWWCLNDDCMDLIPLNDTS